MSQRKMHWKVDTRNIFLTSTALGSIYETSLKNWFDTPVVGYFKIGGKLLEKKLKRTIVLGGATRSKTNNTGSSESEYSPSTGKCPSRLTECLHSYPASKLPTPCNAAEELSIVSANRGITYMQI